MHVPFRPAIIQPMMLVTHQPQNSTTTTTSEGSPLLVLPSRVDNGGQTTPLSPPPYGRWNDYLCDCCAYGCCHPSFFNAVFFPRILIAQIMTRMKLNICAIPVNDRTARRTCPTMVLLILLVTIFQYTMNCDKAHLKFTDHGIAIDKHSGCSHWQWKLQWVVPTLFGLYTFIILAKLRRAVRQKYRIPINRNSCGCSICFCCGCCSVWEDLCCAFWCSCCTIAQLARQTGDYDKNHAACCTRDGFRRRQHTSAIPVPAIVV